MRAPRFRLRTLLVGVAVAGLVLGGSALARRSREYRAKAADHFAAFQVYTYISMFLEDSKPFRLSDLNPAYHRFLHRGMIPLDLGHIDAIRYYHRALAEKYRWAADRPWWPISRDPAPPPPE